MMQILEGYGNHLPGTTYLHTSYFKILYWPFALSETGERGGSVVERRTPEQEVGGSKPTSALLCP